MEIWPGQPYPLGATLRRGRHQLLGVLRAWRSGSSCRSSTTAANETRIDLPEMTALCWHGYVPDVRPGQRYGFRVHGAWAPEHGHWCNPAKLLLDPYAKAIDGRWDWNEAMFPYQFGEPETSRNDLDSAPFVPKAVVINPFFDWGNDRRPNTPVAPDDRLRDARQGLHQERIPTSPRSSRHATPAWRTRRRSNICSGLASRRSSCCRSTSSCRTRRCMEKRPAQLLGLQLDRLPRAAQRVSPASREGGQVQEFKQLVKTLHEAGIEVILDVVYNHTAEGNHLGPMLSFKGIDNAAYYRLVADKRRYYMDYTGTGNTLNMRHPHVLQLIMDSLRYWVLEMHVDGFRFDLAATLARELHDVDRLSAFFDLIQQDPVVSQVKLIAEPWDIGEGGYQVGNFPPLWSEWNGKYRDTVRDFWRGTDQTIGGVRLPVHRQLRSLSGHRAPSRTRASTSSPRTTASRCAISCRTTTSTTRPTAKTTATARATTGRGTAARKDRPTIAGGQRAAGAAAAQLPGDAAALAGRADAARRRRDRPHAARQQQRLLPGQRDLVVRLGVGRPVAAAVHPQPDPAAPAAPGLLPAPLVPGAARSTAPA